MTVVSNTQIYGLDESIYRSGYPMLHTAPSEKEFEDAIFKIKLSRNNQDKTNEHINRAINLSKAKGGGHDQFLTGIIVQFDLSFTNKAWVEAERYTFLNFISSMSTMHKVSSFDLNNCCNDYVSEDILKAVNKLRTEYVLIDDSEQNKEKKKQAYLKLLYNLPNGLIITAGMTTNYRCLKNIYQQRKNHRLPDWQEFCKWIETLPMKELIIGE